MPTIKMVARSTTTCKKVVRYRHVLQKSYKRSRRSGSMVRVGDVKENLDVSIRTSNNGGVFVNNESPKEHDNEEHPLSFDMDTIEWQNFASFNGCADLIVQTGFFPFSVYGSTYSGSDTLLSYYHRADDAHCNLFEAVNQEQIAIATQVVDNTFPNFQTPNMLDSYVNQAYPDEFSSDGFVFDDSFDYSALFDDLDFSGTDLLYDFPTFEQTIEAPNYHYAGSCEQLPEQMPDSSLFDFVCHQAKPHPEELEAISSQFDSERVDYTDQETFIKNFLEISDEPASLPALVNDEPSKTKNTLVLDMDETLIHSTMGHYDSGADFTIQILLNDKEHPVYVRKRPFLHEFLEKVSKMFEIIVFTASKQLYAEKLLDVLDPDNKLFSRRVYRDSCIYLDGCYTKDLTVLGIDLAKVAIVDNCPQVFRLQVNNGIPIESWFDDPSDSALISLLPFLEKLVDADDVRPIIAEKFGNKKD